MPWTDVNPGQSRSILRRSKRYLHISNKKIKICNKKYCIFLISKKQVEHFLSKHEWQSA